MTKNWNDIPPELKEMVVDRADVVTRIKLSMCSKADKALVRRREYEENRRIKFNRFEGYDDIINIQFPSDSAMNGGVLRIERSTRGSSLSTNTRNAKFMKFPEQENLKETVIRVLNRLTSCQFLNVNVDDEFKEMFLWLRRNFELRPRSVWLYFSDDFCYEQSMFIETCINWGKDIKVHVHLRGGKPSIFQRHKTYPQLRSIDFNNHKKVYIADKYLNKMPNLKAISLCGWKVTLNWFYDFVNNWIHRPDDKTKYNLKFRSISWRVKDIEKKFQGIIEYSDQRFSNHWGSPTYRYWQIAVKKDLNTFGLIDIDDEEVRFSPFFNVQDYEWYFKDYLTF